MSLNVDIAPLAQAEPFLADWRMLAMDARPGFFQSEAWVATWVQEAISRGDLNAVRAFDGDRIVLLGIIGVARAGNVPVLHPVEARLAETGVEAVDSVYVEYNDFLVSPSAPDGAREAAWGAVFDEVQADSYIIRNATEEARNALFAVAERRNWAGNTITSAHSHIIDLAALRDAGKSVLDSVSKNAGKQVSRAIRLYEERGLLALTAVDGSAAWPELRRLHEAVWQARGQEGVFANPHMTKFHEALRRDYPGAVEFLELRAGDSLIGSLYNFRQGGVVMNYQSGFAYEEDNRLKPGLVTHVMAAQAALDAGLETYDMLVGDARYKQSLGTPHAQMMLVEVERPTLTTRLRGAAKRARARFSR